MNRKIELRLLVTILILFSFLFSGSFAFSEDKEDMKKLEKAASHPLNDFFIFKKDNKIPEAIEVLTKWKTVDQIEQFYKDFFFAQITANPDQATKGFWNLYLGLKKSRKLLRLQLDSLNSILDILLTRKLEQKPPFNDRRLKVEVKLTLRKVRGLPEGLDFELKYLKWIVKNNVTEELCHAERNRWISQVNLKLKEVMEGVSKCPMGLDDFIYRTRLLVFSGAEKQAQSELDDFVLISKLQDWEKAYLKAVYFSNIGDPVSAFEIVKKYETEILKSEDYYNNLFYIAQRAGELVKAEDLINKIILKAKTQKQKSDFFFQKAFLFYQTKKYADAIVILNSLIGSHPLNHKKRKNSEYDDLTWLRAWCYYLNKDYTLARNEFQKNKEWTRDKSRNLYWLAQTEWALGNQIQGLEYFKKLALPNIEGKFFNYYNYLAWVRYETNRTTVSNDLMKSQISLMKAGRGNYMLPDILGGSERDLLKAYREYVEEISTTDEGDIQVVNQDSVIASQSETEGIAVEKSAQLKKEVTWADHLLEWGFGDLAKWHLFDVEKSFKTRKSAEPLINYYLDKKFYYRALTLMQRVSSTQDKKISLKEDELLWKSIYPKAYELNVKSEAMLRKVDPYLIWSIMKAETQFKADAISPVGAVGLMQFMPYTSQKVAQLLKERDHDPKILFQPDAAVQHGAVYLKKLSREFDDQLPLVAAAYNGGPHRVKLWLRNFGEIDFDVFVEHIPFGETRTYVKRVLSFMKTYQKLYEEKQDFKKSQWLIGKNLYKIVEPISLKEEWDFSGSPTR